MGQRGGATGVGTLASHVFLGVGAVAALLYLAVDNAIVEAVVFGIVVVGSCLTVAVAPRLHGARPHLPWALLAVAGVLFFVGAVLRPWAADKEDYRQALSDFFTLPGYLIGLLAVVLLLRARGSLERHAIADGLIVCLAAGTLSVQLFTVPAVEFGGRPVWLSTLAGLYPAFDVLLVLVVVNLAFTTLVRRRSFELLIGALTAMLLGDIGYAYIGRSGALIGSQWLDLPFLVAYTLLGAAVAHPSMVDLGREMPRAVQAWSWRRLSLLVPALATPFISFALLPPGDAELRLVVSVLGAGMVAALLFRAVSAVHAYARAQANFRHQATHDALTGLPNRVLLTEQVGALLTRRRTPDAPVWLLFLDLDGFKLVNDSWGHETGDRLIVAVARRLRGAVAPDVVVARVSGDEFVVAAEATRQEADALAQRVLVALAAPFDVDGADLVVTASIGMAGAARTGTAETLMRDADTAMYRAKSEGRGRCAVFDPSMRQRVRNRVDIELALRHAVARGQLAVVYQPIVDLRSERWLGAEALLRWMHPLRGPVSPEEFIPVAEDTGLILELGEWVLEQAAEQLGEWRRTAAVPEDFFLSVNVSTRQLRDNALPDAVAALLQRCRLPSHALVLEITETVMIDDSPASRHVLEALRALGVRLSVDDFGTGYSALGYLRRYPVTGVKIDREFVDGLGHDAEDEEIVRAVTAMSSALGLTVVAEGVETRTQRDVLRAVGVEQAQGMLFSPGLGPSAFVGGLAAHEGSVSARSA